MKTRYASSIEETLITFHTGRGGHFHNAGHVSVCDFEKTIGSYTDDLFLNYENSSHLYRLFKGYENLTNLLHEATSDNNSAVERLQKWGFDLGEKYYCDNNGQPVISEEEADNGDGTGTINIDNDYDTTIVRMLKDCDEDELFLILKYNGYKPTGVDEYVKEALGIEEEECEEEECEQENN